MIENAAREPEVVDLANCLVAMGAQISGAGTDVIRIRGVERLHGATHRIMPDRIETGTYLCAAAATGGEIRLTGTSAAYLDVVIDKLMDAGCEIAIERDAIRLKAPERLTAVSIRTAPYPAFPTDMQAQFMAINAVADGTAIIRETIFENRFMHAVELIRLGADIKIDGNTAVVKGVEQARRRHGHGHRPARLGQPGHRRPGGQGRDAGRSHLPPRSRLRRPGPETDGAGSARSAGKIAAMNATNAITIALSKGRIFEETLPLLAAAGIVPSENPEQSRKLIIGTNRPDVRVVIVRASDVPTYVQYGAADLGIAGKDVLLEHGGTGLYQPLDLEDRQVPAVRGGAGGLRLRGRRAARRAPAHRHQVHPDGARALRRQGRACRPDQALRFDGTGAAGRPGRCHRRPGFQRRHAQGQQPGRGRGDHGRSRRAWWSIRPA